VLETSERVLEFPWLVFRSLVSVVLRDSSRLDVVESARVA
jgi:hypothetical protein